MTSPKPAAKARKKTSTRIEEQLEAKPPAPRMFPIQKASPVPWELAERAYTTYARLFGTSQSLEDLGRRGGFGVQEFACLLAGHYPKSDHPECIEKSDAAGRRMAHLRSEFERVFAMNQRLADAGIPTILYCPECKLQHVDEGEWATKPHRIHRCLGCGHEWRPFDVATYGVRALGLERPVPAPRRMACVYCGDGIERGNLVWRKFDDAGKPYGTYRCDPCYRYMGTPPDDTACCAAQIEARDVRAADAAEAAL